MPFLATQDKPLQKLHQLRERNKIVLLQIKQYQLEDSIRQVITLSDITTFAKGQQSLLKQNFSLQLTASLCHEVMNPLNSIVNLSNNCVKDSLQLHLRQERGLTKHRVNLKVVQSSAALMRLMLSSQITCMKHQVNQL